MHIHMQGDGRLKDNSSRSWNEIDMFIVVYIHINGDIRRYMCWHMNA